MSSSSTWGPRRPHSWETQPHAWEEQAQPDPDSEEECTAESAGEALVELLCVLKFSGSLSARHVCLLAHWAAAAGAVGSVAKLGKGPGAQSGAYASHFDHIIGHREVEADLYWIDVPQYRRCDGTRISRRIPVFPPHETLSVEFAQCAELSAEVERSVRAREWPLHTLTTLWSSKLGLHVLCRWLSTWTQSNSPIGMQFSGFFA